MCHVRNTQLCETFRCAIANVDRISTYHEEKESWRRTFPTRHDA